MTKTRTFFSIGFSLLFIAVTSALGYGQTVRWDIATIVPSVGPGGVTFSRANDGATIRLTGSGTFVVSPEPGVTLSGVTGSGTWQTFPGTAASSVAAASGTFVVTGLEHWERVPDIPGLATAVDRIGNPTEQASGLAILRVTYSDGSRGLLTVGCIRAGAPLTGFEGVIASKGAVTFFNPVPPVAGIDANRTLFHVSP